MNPPDVDTSRGDYRDGFVTCAALLPNTEAGTKAAHEARMVFEEVGAPVLVQRLEDLTQPQL